MNTPDGPHIANAAPASSGEPFSTRSSQPVVPFASQTGWNLSSSNGIGDRRETRSATLSTPPDGGEQTSSGAASPDGEGIPESIGSTIPDSIGSTVWPMTTAGLLVDRWERAWDDLSGLPRTGFFETMISRYTEPRRHFRSLHRLAECFDAYDPVSHLCDRPVEIEMAIWFHGAVHDPLRKDNVVLSSELAFASLTKSGVEVLAASRVAKLVLATAHRNPPTSNDMGMLLDVDLSILGASPERFLQYENQIRWEHAHMSDELFIKARTQFVARHLRRVREGGNVFHTQAFRSTLEASALANLHGSLKRLKAGILPPRTPKMTTDGFYELSDD